jgi:hypothetical protein
MYIVPIAWLYVTVMMAVAEASSPQGTLLGACITFLLYGLLPMGIVLYIMGTPARKRAIRAREAAQQAAQVAAAVSDSNSATPDGHRHAAADAVAPVRKEP